MSSGTHAASASPPTPLFVLRGHRSPIHTIGFVAGATAQTAAAAAAGTGVVAAASTPSRPLPSASRPALPVLLSGDAAGCVVAWNLTTRRAATKIQAHTGPVLAVHALEQGRIIVSQGKDGTLKLWPVPTAAPGAAPTNAESLHTIDTGSYTFFKSVCLELTKGEAATDAGVEKNASDAEAASASSPRALFQTSRPLLLAPCEEASNFALYDLSASLTTPLQVIETERRVPRDADVEENMRARLTEAEAKEMDALLASQPPSYERKVGMTMAARFFVAGVERQADVQDMRQMYIAWASEAGIVGVWDVTRKEHVFQQQVHKDTILSFDLSWDGSYGVSCSSGSDIAAWSIDLPGKCIREIGRINVPHEGLAEVVLREDGKLLATAGWDHRVRLFDSATLQPLAILREHTETVQCVAMPSHATPTDAGASSGLIASGAKDGKIAVYQLYAEHNTLALQPSTPGAIGVSAKERHQQIYDARQAQQQPPPTQPLIEPAD